LLAVSGVLTPTASRDDDAQRQKLSRTDPRSWRLNVYPAAIVAVLAGVVVLTVLAGTGTSSDGKHLGGDYPAFYAAGTIAADGDWDRLYEAEAQQQAQLGLVDDEGGFLYFAYPPPVAATYGLLSRLDYRWSYLLHTILMGMALWGAVRLARPVVPVAARNPTRVFAVALVSYPLFRAVTGGQNTALTLLLLVGAARFDAEDRSIVSGLCVGLMLYTPQFAVGLIVLMLVRKRWTVAATALGVGAGMWVWSAALLRSNWFSVWWSKAVDVSRIDANVNSSNLISFAGSLEHVAGSAGEVLGWGLLGLLVAAVVALWWKRRDLDPTMFFGLAAGVAVLVLPRPLFYEAGLVLSLAVLAAKQGEMRWVAFGALGTWAAAVTGDAGAFPVTVLAAATMVWAVRRFLREDEAEPATDAPATAT